MLFYTEDALMRMSTAEYRSIDTERWVVENAHSISKPLSNHLAFLSSKFGVELTPGDFITDIYLRLPSLLASALERTPDVPKAERTKMLIGTSVNYMKQHAYTVLREHGVDTMGRNNANLSLSEHDQAQEAHALYFEMNGDTDCVITDVQLLSNGEVDHSESANLLHTAIEQIPNITDASRTMLRLRTVEGYTVKQIAETMGMSQKTADAQMLRLRHRLADLVRNKNPNMASFADSLRFVEQRQYG